MAAQDFTKDQIFNMSDEEFDKNFGELPDQDSSANDYQSPDLMTGENKPQINDGNIDDNVDDVVDNTKGIEQKTIDNRPRFWDNSTQDSKATSKKEEQPLDQTSDDTQDVEDEYEPEEQTKPQQSVYQVKAYGQKYNFTTEELLKLAPKALHYTKKLQKIAPYRRTISAMEENGISEDDVNQFIEMKKGNRTAIANFLSKANVDAYDLTNYDEQESAKYAPLKYGREQNELTRVIEDVQEHPMSDQLQRYLVTLDQESKNRISANPSVLEVLISNMENGYFDQIAPEANKRAFLDGNRKPMIEYYAEACEDYYKYLDAQEDGDRYVRQKQNRNEQRAKTRVSTGGSKSSKPKKEIRSAEDISDEEFEAWEKEMGLSNLF